MSPQRSRNWCYTLNNYTVAESIGVSELESVYHVRGYELGENGTPHIQGFIQLESPKALTAMKKLIPRAHLEIMNGTAQQASDYCKKEGDFMESGTLVQQGQRNDLKHAIQLIRGGTDGRTVADQCPEVFVRYGRGLRDLMLQLTDPYSHTDVRGMWFVGRPGTGKSRTAREYPNIYLKPQNKWWDGYNGEETVVLDDLDKGGECLGHHLKIWTDRYACTGETKGGTTHLRHHRFIVTSNFRMSELWEGEMLAAIQRRFVVRDFNIFPWHDQSAAPEIIA